MHQVTDALRIRIFADGPRLDDVSRLNDDPAIAGFTTNPTLLRQGGVTDYLGFVKDLTSIVPEKPISFEVVADDFEEMARQARLLAAMASNVYVKIPITDTSGQSSLPLMADLAADGVSVNATALLTLAQVEGTAAALADGPPGVVSVFAGRIADTGADPVPVMCQAAEILADHPALELLWASPREVLNLLQADAAGCDIITMTAPLLAKVGGIGRDLDDLSLATVQMFRDDALAAGYEF